MEKMAKNSGYFEGQLLAAMPQMTDRRFAQSVIYLCAHSADGAMGLVVNKLIDGITFPDLLQQLNIETTSPDEKIRVHFGGPVESGRGFVLHSDDYVQESTLVIRDGVALTATVEVLRDIAEGNGPTRSLLALGYAGWAPGQLDSEIKANGWLNVTADENLIFGGKLDNKWSKAIAKLGIDLLSLSSTAGHA
ncbi:MAG: YqgE/AlgH family protein [Planctomycetes bacterium]|nr:YqgE/AlgH family protein [Planctomycetota bacterium]